MHWLAQVTLNMDEHVSINDARPEHSLLRLCASEPMGHEASCDYMCLAITIQLEDPPTESDSDVCGILQQDCTFLQFLIALQHACHADHL